MKLSSIIQWLEKDAESNEKLAKNGSSVTSMAEDREAGAVAENQRRIIEKLKQVISL